MNRKDFIVKEVRAGYYWGYRDTTWSQQNTYYQVYYKQHFVRAFSTKAQALEFIRYKVNTSKRAGLKVLSEIRSLEKSIKVLKRLLDIKQDKVSKLESKLLKRL